MKKLFKSVLNGIGFSLERDKHEEINFNGETLTFTLQMIKIWTNKWAFKNLKKIVIVLVEDIVLLQQKYMVI